MQYKIFSYELDDERGKPIGPDRHIDVFRKAIGVDDTGRLTTYYGKNDTVLMFVRAYRSDFTALVGRHSTQRDVTAYDEREDETLTIAVDDDDYPNVPVILMPRLRMIAVMDGGKIAADSAISRINAILAHRQKAHFVARSVRESFDLRSAVEKFSVFEVSFEILPVNPHTGDIGRAFDESRKQDHIEKILGKAEASSADPMKLNGGFLTAVQQLQQSGHAKVGYRALTNAGIEINVPKPSKARPLRDEVTEDDSEAWGEHSDVKVIVPDARLTYPFTQAHIIHIRTIARQFSPIVEDDA